MDEATKKVVRGILYSPAPKDDELEKFTGVKHIRQLRFNSNPGNANMYNIHVFRYKIEKIVEATSEDETIMNILHSNPSGTELAKTAGVSSAAVSRAKKKETYGYKYYKLLWMIEQIAKEVDAG